MLVLGRKVGESIVIGGEIRVTLLSVEGERARIGIEAPRSVPVVRQELFEAVRAENLQAAARPVDRNLISNLNKVLRSASTE